MLKRIITTAVLSVAATFAPTANATDLDKALSSLQTMSSTNRAGFYSSADRNVFVAGGVDVRFPRSSNRLALMSITPPRLDAGCGGISAHFGGFSFVNSQQIEGLIKNIGQNAVGMVVSVVIKTLCPICDAVIQAMTKLAADASKLSIDSCAVATNLTASLAAAAQSDKSTMANVCGKQVAVGGESPDMLSAVQGVDAVCSGLSSAMEKVGSAIKKAEGRDGKPDPGASDADKATAAEAEQYNLYGNTTWNTLNAVYGKLENLDTQQGQDELRNRMLLMNVLGTEIIASATDSKRIEPYVTQNATLSPKLLFDLFMCGAPLNINAKGDPEGWAKTANTRAYCKYFYGSSANPDLAGMGQNGGYEYIVYECGPSDLERCLDPYPVKLGESQILKGRGFLPQIELILFDAVEAVRTNAEGGFSDEFMNLAQTVNFPIYQAINAAAVYPASTHDLMSTMSMLVAESLVYAKLEEIVRPQGKNPRDVKLNRKLAERAYEVLENMNKTHLAQKESYGRMMAVQEGAVQSIRQINLAVQKQVLTPNLLGNQKYGTQIPAEVAGNTK